jgi:hypothetical protein
VILNAPLCEMNRMAIVPANEFVELDAMAVYGNLTQAIRLYVRNLNELRRARNLRLANLGAPPRVALACCSAYFDEIRGIVAYRTDKAIFGMHRFLDRQLWNRASGD